MENSTLFTGYVVTSNAASYCVAIARENSSFKNADGGSLIQGIPLTQHFAYYLGFKEALLPQPGTKVLCLENTPDTCFILASIPENDLSFQGTQPLNLPQRVTLGSGDAGNDSANRKGHTDNFRWVFNNRRPTDVVDGEYVVANELGVLLGLFQQMATLKASELSQIQCYLLDDLVRIISHNFQHYTALGEYNIYHDGKSIMAEFGATHIPQESYGRPAVEDDGGSPVFEFEGASTTDDSQDFYKIKENEQIKAVERFKIFLGRLGDFFHMYLVRPDPKEVRTSDPDVEVNNPDLGLFDFHIGTDGGLHVRSLKEIFLERTNWIRVPSRKAAPDDPNGDDAEELEYEEKEKFEFDSEYKYKNNPLMFAQQLRDYVAYVNENLNYKNFKKHEKDFKVNDTISKEKRTDTSLKIDKETKLDLADYKLRNSGIYLMPNGGIVLRDAWGSAIVMEGGNISLQPAKDLFMQPLRNMVAKVGGFTSIATKEDIDLSSTDKGFRLKTNLAQYLYSHESGVVIESAGENDSTGSPDPETSAIEKIGGVVIKSKKGIYNYAAKDIVNLAKGRLVLQSIDQVDISAGKDVYIYSKGDMHSIADQSMILYGKENSYLLGDRAAISGKSSTLIGNKGSDLGVEYDKDSMFVDKLAGVVPTDTIIKNFDALLPFASNPIQYCTFSSADKFESLKFNFLESSKYGNLEDEDAIPSTLPQQEDELSNIYNLVEWEEKKINGSVPYPGAEKFDSFLLKADKPNNLEKGNIGEKDYVSKASSGKTPAKISKSSLKQYKVQKTK